MMSTAKYLRLLTALLLCLSLFSGCSLRQMIISRLDWLLMRKMDHYFDLSAEQYRSFRAKGQVHLNWFADTQIPGIIADLEHIRATQGPLDPEHMRKLLDGRSRAVWLAIADRLSPDAAELFKQLSPEQFDHFEKALAEDTEDFVELAELPPHKFPKAYRRLQEQLMDKMETWVGPLTVEQKARILALTAVKQEEYRQELGILLEIKKEFLRQIKEQLKGSDVEAFLKAWARQPNVAGERYAMYQDWQVNRQLELWIAMEQMVTEKQRIHRRKELAKLIGDLQLIQSTRF